MGGMSAAQGRRDQAVPAVTAASLDRAALRYLERYASSGANLRRVLMRRVERAVYAGAMERDEGARLVDALIERYVAAGLLDDKNYAEHKAASLVRAGRSRYRIRGMLRQKGVAPDQVEDAIAGLDGDADASERVAAGALIRRRRLGPYRAKAERASFLRKDLAALSRAGFALDLALRLLRAPDPEALDKLVRDVEGEE